MTNEELINKAQENRNRIASEIRTLKAEADELIGEANVLISRREMLDEELSRWDIRDSKWKPIKTIPRPEDCGAGREVLLKADDGAISSGYFYRCPEYGYEEIDSYLTCSVTGREMKWVEWAEIPE